MIHHQNKSSHEQYPDPHHDIYSNTVFGFWIYLISDFILFATLFAVYEVLRNNTFGGPPAKELFNIHFAFFQAIVLLIASFTAGLGGVYAHRRNKNKTLLCFALTFLLGLAFMRWEIKEFLYLIDTGNSWQRSGFLSGYFTLVGTHGAHMIFALLWIPVLLYPLWRDGITDTSLRRITCLKIFWQFLNVVWIFIFTFVYLMGRS